MAPRGTNEGPCPVPRQTGRSARLNDQSPKRTHQDLHPVTVVGILVEAPYLCYTSSVYHISVSVSTAEFLQTTTAVEKPAANRSRWTLRKTTSIYILSGFRVIAERCIVTVSCLPSFVWLFVTEVALFLRSRQIAYRTSSLLKSTATRPAPAPRDSLTPRTSRKPKTLKRTPLPFL